MATRPLRRSTAAKAVVFQGLEVVNPSPNFSSGSY